MDQEQMMKMMIEGNYGPLPGADSAAVCRQGADEGIVLLKNEGGAPDSGGENRSLRRRRGGHHRLRGR